MQISVIGLDIAKQFFQVHAIDAEGRGAAQVKLRRAQVLDYFRSLSPCLVGMEACATAHFWARELVALGHEVRLMPPAYVKPYVKRNKATRPMQPTQRRSLKPSRDRRCGSWR